MWVDLKDYDGRYRISDEGEVQSFFYGRWRPISQRMYPGGLCVQVKRNGSYTTKAVSRLMAEAFFGGVPEGYSVMHKSACVSDNRLSNLTMAPTSEVRSRCGGHNRRPVLKLAPDGEVVKIYRSVREAAKGEHFATNSMRRRLCGELKRPDPQGFTYRYESKR